MPPNRSRAELSARALEAFRGDFNHGARDAAARGLCVPVRQSAAARFAFWAISPKPLNGNTVLAHPLTHMGTNRNASPAARPLQGRPGGLTNLRSDELTHLESVGSDATQSSRLLNRLFHWHGTRDLYRQVRGQRRLCR
jgi:hypothetical protein